MKVTNFPSGLPGAYFQGQYVQPNIAGKSNVFWVDCNNPLGNGPGTAANPFTRVSYALQYCKPNNGDIIFLAPGHHEDIQSVFEISVSGISIIALGIGAQRASYSVSGTDTTACYFFSGNNILVSNVRWLGDCPDLVTGVLINGQGCVFDNCDFGQEGSAPNSALTIGGAAAGESDKTIIQNCTFNLFTSNGTSNSAIFISYSADSIQLINNTIYGVYNVAALQVSGQTTPTNLQVIGNAMQNTSTAPSVLVASFGGNATGFVDGNKWYGTGGTLVGGGDKLQFGVNYGTPTTNDGASQIPAHT